VPTADAEIARAWFVERFREGFEEAGHGDATELAAYVDVAGAAEIRAAFDDARSQPVEEGWEERWKEFHRPVTAAGLWIGPPWTAPPADADAVVVDPGRAFGTGAHPTTRACIELLAGLERGSLLDAGCGSGVVAVAAARLGFGPVQAVDVDPVAVEATRETARLNAVTVDARAADATRDPLPQTDVLVANIELGVVEAVLARTASPIAVTSGYLAADAPRAPGWAELERLELEGWRADVLGRRH
jgi:ribosomal protein L11 methyltransferase